MKKIKLHYDKIPEKVVDKCKNDKYWPYLLKSKKNILLDESSDSKNLLIEGDNYHALSVLSYTHREKIDVIYIDPPYNRKNRDFMYNDCYIDEDDNHKHSKYLSFMENRLVLARDLLTPNGTIFVSIDDNEHSRLKILMDEIFGEENFVKNIVWRNFVSGRNQDKFIKNCCEHILVYKRNDCNIGVLKYTSDSIDEYCKTDKISKFKKGHPLHNDNSQFNIYNRPNLCYSIYYNPKTGEIRTRDEKIVKRETIEIKLNQKTHSRKKIVINKNPDATLINAGFVRILPRVSKKFNGLQKVWRWGQDKLLNEYKNEIIVKKNRHNEYYPYMKKRLNEDSQIEEKPKNFIDFVKTVDGGNDLYKLFGEKSFPHPKPVKLIKHLIGLINDKNITVLDFFAGSGTTGQAVLELNKEDCGNRKFILCTNNENKICENITYPRISKIMHGYLSEENQNEVLFSKKIDLTILKGWGIVDDTITNIKEEYREQYNKFKIEIKGDKIILAGIVEKGRKIPGISSNLLYYRITDDTFVKIGNSDQSKREFSKKCGDMISIIENTFDCVRGFNHHDNYQMFYNKNSISVIIYKLDEIKNFIKKFKGLKNDSRIRGKKIKCYVFSYNHDVKFATSNLVKALGEEMSVTPIPNNIFNVYCRIFKEQR